MTVIQQGAVNTTALIVPDLYVQIIPPSISYLNGVPTNILGMVGTATWGAVNSPVTISSMADYAHYFGQIQTNKYDMGTAAAAAILQGANNLRCVRVTDGTDTAATVDVADGGGNVAVTFNAYYTGSVGNTLVATIANGSAPHSYKLTVALPGLVPEVFDNLTSMQALVDAVNLGQSGIRAPSQLIRAVLVSETAPLLQSYFLSGGTNGNDKVTVNTLLGQDTYPRTGMYALRNTQASIALLVDGDDPKTYAEQVAFGLSEGMYMLLVGTPGQTIDQAITEKQNAGIDSYAAKLLLGDWIYFNDTVNNQVRLISPQGFIGGLLANLSPAESSLNKQLYGIVGTQKTYNQQRYSQAELTQLVNAGIDVITNPAPGGNYYAARIGHNTSSNPVINGDNYTRMTNYIAYTLNAGMGLYVGKLQTTTERLQAKNTIQTFLSNMEQQGLIGDVNGGAAYSVVLDESNNPSSRVALGFQQADVKVVYLSVVEKFIINVEGGVSVQIQRQTTAPTFS